MPSNTEGEEVVSAFGVSTVFTVSKLPMTSYMEFLPTVLYLGSGALNSLAFSTGASGARPPLMILLKSSMETTVSSLSSFSLISASVTKSLSDASNSVAITVTARSSSSMFSFVARPRMIFAFLSAE